MHGVVPNKELNEELRNILGQLASNSNLLDPPNNIQHIMFLLEEGANPNIQNQDGKTLSYYLDEKLFNILNELASNSNSLGDYNYIQYITSLLRVGADPNVQNQDGKTLLHYVAERNNIDDIRYFLEVIKANPNVQDRSEKTPFEYVTEHAMAST